MSSLPSLRVLRIALSLAPIMLGAALLAQAPAAPVTPSAPAAPTKAGRGPQQPPVLSPEISAERQVTFRLRAPDAKTVNVSGQFQSARAEMTKDDSGLWSVTVGPIAPGVYEYSFNVDGLSMIDPGNRDVKPMRAPRTSILEIPGEPPLVHDFQNVPHGRVSLHWYMSKSLGRRRALQVYTPPGYDAHPSMRFPTMYLFHGNGDNEATWVAHGHAHWILDNLIAQNRAQPMIVVMLDGHAIPPGTTAARGNTAAFERDLLEDAMPLIAANYRTREEPAHRAIVGLSMGGNQALAIGLKHAERFAWIGGMSSSTQGVADVIGDGAALNRQLKLLWIACGTEDSAARVAENKAVNALLTAKNVKHEFVLTEGNHSWPVWRRHLAELAPKLFQPSASPSAGE